MDHVKSLKKGKLNTVALLVCISLFLVLFLHHRKYTYFDSLDSFKNLNEYAFLSVLALIAVAGFVFLSGYKLTKTELGTTQWKFWKKRILRIYPFYFLSLIPFSLIVMKNDSIKDFLIHAFLLQTIVPNSMFDVKKYLTLWFIGVLFFYYIFFSLSRRYIKNLRFFISLSIITFLSLLYIRNTTGFIDYLMPLYFLVFVSGMIYSHYESSFKLSRKTYTFFGILSLVSLGLLFLERNQIFFDHLFFRSLFLLLFSVSFFIPILSINSTNNSWNKYLEVLAYASYGMFLFHRPIWQLMQTYWGEATFYQWAYISIGGTLLIFIFSWLLQYSYDYILRKMRQ